MTHRVEALALIDSLGQGGAERSLVEQAVALRLHDIAVDVLVLRSTSVGDFTSDAKTAGVNVMTAQAESRYALIREIRSLLKGYDLVHTTLFESDVIGRIAAAGTGVPVLSSLVNTTYSQARLADRHVSKAKLGVVRSIDGWTARYLTAHFHAITEVVARAAVNSLGISPDHITVVPRGRDPLRIGNRSDKRRHRVRDQLGILEESSLFINVGRHEYQKGQDVLIRAMPEVRSQLPSAQLLIVGRTGNATDDLRRLVKELDLGDHVILTGFRADVIDLLAASDVFVFPSHYEGLGGSLLEAMALEVPIVATSIPSSLEVLGDNAAFVQAGDTSGLAASMVELASFPSKAKRLAAGALSRFEDRFSFDRVIEQTAELYRKVARLG